MQLSKIYTRGGDKGETHLVGGERVSKAHYLMELAGSLDELNCFIGQLRTLCLDLKNSTKNLSQHSEIIDSLAYTQNLIFDIGSLLACSPNCIPQGMPIVDESFISTLEKQIDLMNECVNPLPSFVLPGGSPLNSSAHICRAICRRVERQLVANLESLSSRQKENPLKIINRLSDWFFAFSRYLSHIEEVPEYLWQHPLKN